MLTLRKYSVCRLCLCASHRLMDILEDDCGVEFTVTEALNDLLQIEVDNDNINGLPWQICSSCLDKLADFRLFKRRCWECKVTFESRLQNAVHLLNNGGNVQPSVVTMKNTNGEIQEGQLMKIAHVEGLVRVSEDLFPRNKIATHSNIHFAPEERKIVKDFEEKEKSCDGVMGGKNTQLTGNCDTVKDPEEEVFHVKLEPIVEVSLKKGLVKDFNDEKEVAGKELVESVLAESPCVSHVQPVRCVKPPAGRLNPIRVRQKPFWACDYQPSLVPRKRKNEEIQEGKFMQATPVKGLVRASKDLVATSETTSHNNLNFVTEEWKNLSECEETIEKSCDGEVSLKNTCLSGKKESNYGIIADGDAQSSEPNEKNKLNVCNVNDCCGNGSDGEDDSNEQTDVPEKVPSGHVELSLDQKERVMCLPLAHPMCTREKLKKYPFVMMNDTNQINEWKRPVVVIQQKHSLPSRVSPKSQDSKRSSKRLKSLSKRFKHRCSACF